MPTAGRCWPHTFPTQTDSTMCASSDATHSPLSTSSAADSPARISATPASAPESTESAADFGASTRESFASYDPASSSWKTSQLCLDGELSEFSETWPRAGMTRSGKAFERPMLARHTDESESGLSLTLKQTHHVPTPTSSDYIERRCTNTDRASALNFETNKSVSLDRWVKMWPTPTAEDSQCKGNHPGAVDSLHAAVKLWPTPTVTDAQHPGREKWKPNQQVALSQAVNFRTPQSRDWKGDTTPGLPDQIGGQLNPTWVEWLMGYPLGWTALKDWATRSSRKSRNSSGGKS